jgi:hypothetical protein
MYTYSGLIDHRNRAAFGGKGGGGGSLPPPPPAYTDPVNGQVFTDPTALNKEIDTRAAQAKTDSDATQAKADAQKVQDEADFQTRKGTAVQNATDEVRQSFTDAGVNPDDYMASYITPTINRYAQQIQDLQPNPGGLFPNTLGADVVNQALGAGRTSAGNALSSVFTPTYATDKISDSILTDPTNTIVNEQFDPLSAQLLNASKRGTLNPTGYNAALASLASKKSAATDTVTNLGQGILTKDRGDLNDYTTGATNDAGNLSLANSSKFSVDPYVNQANTMVASDLSGFGGALRNAVGTTQFATLDDLLNAGGAVQGAGNPTAANPNSGATDGTTALGTAILNDTRNRGLGTTGAF